MTKFYFSTMLLLFFSIITIRQGYTQPSIHEIALSFFAPLPKTMPGSEKDTLEQISLGKKLYFETFLSKNKTQSCNSCHNIINGAPGVDHLTVSIGALGALGTRNAPSTWNAGLHVAQFWDGRAKTLEQQAKLPIFNAKEMAMSSEIQVINRLNEQDYLVHFTRAFPNHTQPINIVNISKALASFQRTLITRDRFDEYLSGNLNAITKDEKQGLMVFIEKGCVACHNGSVIGGQLFMKMGLVHPYPNKIDKGMAQVTGNPGDNYMFKVPSLRNVLNTAPYFHDGAAVTIEQAIEDTGWNQLGIRINKKDVMAIKTFFNSLNNQIKTIEGSVEH
ncbi:MAG: cytochrome c peroxidase [Colwellia sp.]